MKLEQKIALFPMQNQISYACFIWIFGIGLILFLTVQQLLEQHYLAVSFSDSPLILNNGSDKMPYNYNNFTLSSLFNHLKTLYLD